MHCCRRHWFRYLAAPAFVLIVMYKFDREMRSIDARQSCDSLYTRKITRTRKSHINGRIFHWTAFAAFGIFAPIVTGKSCKEGSSLAISKPHLKCANDIVSMTPFTAKPECPEYTFPCTRDSAKCWRAHGI